MHVQYLNFEVFLSCSIFDPSHITIAVLALYDLLVLYLWGGPYVVRSIRVKKLYKKYPELQNLLETYLDLRISHPSELGNLHIHEQQIRIQTLRQQIALSTPREKTALYKEIDELVDELTYLEKLIDEERSIHLDKEKALQEKLKTYLTQLSKKELQALLITKYENLIRETLESVN